MNDTTASRQWADRPADERFWGLPDLLAHLKRERAASRETTRPFKDVRVVFDSQDLWLESNKGRLGFTHWSFGQLCSIAGAPASYMRDLHARPDLVSQCLNHGLGASQGDVQIFLNRETLEVRALTKAYTRFWNEDLITALMPALDRGWRVPPARPSVHDPRARPATAADVLPNQGDFGLSVRVGDMIAPAGVYHSDRDLFVFMVHSDRIIDDGVKGLMRGVYLWNSEVGAGAFKVRTFLLENVCGNHICWGVSGMEEIKIVHRGEKIQTADRHLAKKIHAYAHAGTDAESGMIRAARRLVLGKNREETIKRVHGIRSIGLSLTEIETAFETAEKYEDTALATPTTAWGFVHGLTRSSQDQRHADARNRMDRAGGKILALVA